MDSKHKPGGRTLNLTEGVIKAISFEDVFEVGRVRLKYRWYSGASETLGALLVEGCVTKPKLKNKMNQNENVLYGTIGIDWRANMKQDHAQTWWRE